MIEALPSGVDVRAATRRPDSYPVREGREAVAFDFGDRATYRAALQGVEAVFLMRPPRMARGGEVAPFLDAALGAGVERVVALSVKGAGEAKVLPHHAMEREVRERGFAWTMLRPADFMQNFETEHRRGLVEDDEIALPAGDGASALVDVRDVGAVGALALTENGHAGRAYTLTGPDALTFAEVADILSDVLGREIAYRHVSGPRFVWERTQAGEALPKVLVMSALYTAQRLGRAAGVTRTVAELLERPATDFRTYAEREADVWAGAREKKTA